LDLNAQLLFFINSHLKLELNSQLLVYFQYLSFIILFPIHYTKLGQTCDDTM